MAIITSKFDYSRLSGSDKYWPSGIKRLVAHRIILMHTIRDNLSAVSIINRSPPILSPVDFSLVDFHESRAYPKRKLAFMRELTVRRISPTTLVVDCQLRPHSRPLRKLQAESGTTMTTLARVCFTITASERPVSRELRVRRRSRKSNFASIY